MSRPIFPEDEGSFPVLRASEIPREAENRRWLIEHLWGAGAVGIVGGSPKSCKSWLALEMAVSVATASRCLGHYEVLEPGPALVYLAEDSLATVRARLEALGAHHERALDAIDVHVITEGSMRLDLGRDQVRLHKTVRALRPRLLILDPLVRLHRLDENSASEVSGLLSYLRDLQRELDVALLVVHHTRKSGAVGAQAGLGLRGSGDFHAWSDSSLYLRRVRGELLLSIEHRSASAPEPVALHLVGDDGAAHLELVERAAGDPLAAGSIEGRLLEALEAHEPLTRGALRDRLSVKNERLGPALTALEERGLIERGSGGWQRARADPRATGVPCSHPRR